MGDERGGRGWKTQAHLPYSLAPNSFTGGSHAKPTTALTPARVYRCAIDFCQPHLDLRGKGKVTATVLLTVLLAAAARCSSISETCDRLTPPPARPLRQRPVCQPHLPRAAQAQGQRRLPRRPAPGPAPPPKRPLRLIVDLTLLPYYGKHPLDSREIYRGQKKAGTRSFFAYATAYVLLHGQRFTVAVTPVTPSERLKEVLQELLHLVSKAGLRPGLLLLDRGFYNAEIIRYLQRRGGRS